VGRPVTRRLAYHIALCAVVVGALAGPASAAPEGFGGAPVDVIVRELPASGDGPERLVERLGGSVGVHIPLIDGFAATVPADAIDVLRHGTGVHSITTNSPVKLLSSTGFDPVTDPGSTLVVADTVGADDFWKHGIFGSGVDVAVIDSGVAPVNGLTYAGKVLHGPDLSPESQNPELDHIDTYGHGTHMAGIIAGRDDSLTSPDAFTPDAFVGMAPGARVVSVKVADVGGSSDITQVIAAIDWVVQNRNAHGMNIRVLNLSFGTDSTQDYRVDPLTYAVEQAWHKGIVVVAAGGNEGVASETLTNPAYSPYVIAVGGADGRGTKTVLDDVVGDFSSRGSATRRPDLVAPGKSVVSLRSPGSYSDVMHPEGHVGTRFMRASGTSQAAAVVSGAAALLLEQRPELTPDQVKALLTATAQPLPEAHALAQGSGMLDLSTARHTPAPTVEASRQSWERATGTGLVELTRGSYHLYDGDVPLDGERDIFGNPFVSAEWAARSAADASWSGGWWNGNRWTGDGFTSDLCVPDELLGTVDTSLTSEPVCVPVSSAWTDTGWSPTRWAANTWTANSWTANTWTANTWTANTWTANTWTANTWTANTWTANTWTANTWTTAAWDDQESDPDVLRAHQQTRLKDDARARKIQQDTKDRLLASGSDASGSSSRSRR
jgi:serine protease AprX